MEPSDAPLVPVNRYRGYVILPYELTADVYCDETKDPLPFVSKWITSDRSRWSKFELPRGESADAWSLVQFGSEDGVQKTQEVPLGKGIARSTLDEILDQEGNPKESLVKYARLRNFIDQHIQFMNDLNDSEKRHDFYWEGKSDTLRIRSLHRLVRRWLRSDEKDNARLALIVKIARDIAKPLGQVCQSPRVVLRRTREMQNIARIQEIDPACLRWIARQPGRDIYERAGTRQELLGVVRKEDSDTLENRVVRDLLHRARVECSNYVSMYREYKYHERVRTVERFRQSIVDWEQSSEIRTARNLVGFAAQPNYVLLHEPKYRKLWDAYQSLLSQQRQKDDIWKWRDRTFSEICECLAIAMVHGLTKRSMFHKSDVILQHEAVTGKFISKHTEFGALSFQGRRKRHTIVICSGQAGISASLIAKDFQPFGADFFVVIPQREAESITVPFWCFTEVDEATFPMGLELLSKKLESLPTAKSIFPVLMVFHQPQLEQSFHRSQGVVLSVDSPVQASLEKVRGRFIDILERS
jgi:hypothetical protein